MLTKGQHPTFSKAAAQVLLGLLKRKGRCRQHRVAMRRPGFLDTAISTKWGKSDTCAKSMTRIPLYCQLDTPSTNRYTSFGPPHLPKESMHSESSPTAQRTSVVLWGILAALAIASIILAALYYQATRDLEAQKITVAALQLEIAKEVARSAELKSDLNSSRTDAQTLAAKSAQLSSEVNSKEQALAVERENVEAEKSKAESAQMALDQEKSRLPVLPVRIEMRRSAMGRGLVAIFTNTSALQLSVVMGTLNPTTKAVSRKSIQIAPGAKLEIGYLEGIQFASGDEIRMHTAGFEETHYTVP